MIRIANEGSNAFLGAYKDLLSIANSSEELSQDGGLVGFHLTSFWLFPLLSSLSSNNKNKGRA